MLNDTNWTSDFYILTQEEAITVQSTLHPFIFFLMWLNVFLTTGGNLVTIIAFLRDKNIYSKPGNMLILNLAFADLKVGLVSLPWFNLWLHYGDWIFGEHLCKWWVIVDYAATIESMLAMLLISWDRLFMVENIQKYIRNQTRNRVVSVIIGSWLLCYAFCMFAVLLVEPITGERNIDYTVDCDFPPNFYLSVTIFEVIILFVIPVFALFYFNTKIFYIIRKRAKSVRPETLTAPMSHVVDPNQNKNSTSFANQNHQHQQESSSRHNEHADEESTNHQVTRRSLHKDRKAAITLTLLVVTFILCWAPYNFVIIMELVSVNSVPTAFASFTEYLLWLNSVINPFLYVATNPLFRKQLKKMFSCKYHD
ncbi:histamine H4 receptor-like [Amphiura filiformis]|uniref:histamine H4 receptor-like n=1 Tax=Amphiura filiformis TaxID=82378 RepID=UPI003B2211D3